MIFKKPDKKMVELKWKVYGSHFYFIYIIDLIGLSYFIIAGVGAISSVIRGVPEMLIGAVAFMLMGLMILFLSYLKEISLKNTYLIMKAEGLK